MCSDVIFLLDKEYLKQAIFKNAQKASIFDPGRSFITVSLMTTLLRLSRVERQALKKRLPLKLAQIAAKGKDHSTLLLFIIHIVCSTDNTIINSGKASLRTVITMYVLTRSYAGLWKITATRFLY